MIKAIHKIMYRRWDRGTRYIPVIKYLKKRYVSNKTSILEVGSGEYSMGLYDGFIVDAIDLRRDVSKIYTKSFKVGSIVDTDIPSSSYDVVICVDVLEHIKPNDRQKAIYNMLRIAKKEVVLVYPEGKDGCKADSELYKHYKKRVSSYHVWFDEHINYGLPLDGHVTKYIDYSLTKLGKKGSIKKRKINNLKKHLMYSKFLMTPHYLWFQFKNKLVIAFDVLFGWLLKSNKYYRTFLVVRLKS